MYEKILEHLKSKPVVYTPSSSAFWNDEYISKYLLEAHLNPNQEGASRRHDFIKESVQWITSLFPQTKGKKLLDLGCGPGIYDEQFYNAGFSVTGIDFSKRSIEYARNNAAQKKMQIKYLYQNYLDINFSNEFDIATMIYCDFGVLSPSTRQTLLCKVKKALKKEGILIIDGFTKHQLSEIKEGSMITYHEEGFWSPKPHVCIQNNYIYPIEKNYLEQYIIITKDNTECYNMWNQVYDVSTLKNEFYKAGFKVISCFDDVCGKKFSGTEKTICVVAQ